MYYMNRKNLKQIEAINYTLIIVLIIVGIVYKGLLNPYLSGGVTFLCLVLSFILEYLIKKAE